MWKTGFFVLFSFLFREGDAGCSVSICNWERWESWNSCSENCGGGYMYRHRQLCCRQEKLDIGIDACIKDCGKDDDGFDEYASCNEYCHHGGYFHRENTGSHYNYGHCICSQKYAGTCCDIPLCGWDEKWCWPGTCWPGGGNYERYCQCDSGFRKETIGSTTKCQLDSYSSIPDLLTCRIGLETSQRDAVNTTAIGRCADAESIFTKLQPAKLSFSLASSFNINVSSDPTKNRIKEWRFGIVENMVKVIKRSIKGSAYQLDSMWLSGPPACDVRVSDGSPRDMVFCSGELIPATTLQDGESICISFIAYAGGVLKSQDPVTDTYKRTRNQRELCFKMDNSTPEHCVNSRSCTSSLLHLSRRITDSPDIRVTFSLWTDPVPKGGYSRHASGISQYVVELLRVDPLDKSTVEMKYPSLKTATKQPSDTVADILLPFEPALYAVVLEVHDKAGNVRMARRFVLYDNSSTVALFGEKHLLSTTASSLTNYTWQIHHGSTCFNWTGRYFNTHHLRTNLLRTIKPANNISANYDQVTGPLSISGTPNINGIVRFDFTWKLNNQSYQPYQTIADFYSQSLCEDLRPSDGQSYTFQIKPVDINSRFLTEEYVVQVDRSPPDIDNIWLLKDGYKQLFIHNSSDLSKMVLQFEALDEHSGLRTMQWTFGTSDGRADIGSGFLAVHKIDGPCIKQECYCPSIGKCENFVYTINLNKLVANGTHKGQHNREYFFTLVVTNNARLVNIEHMDILADDSPPVEGVIKEGDIGTPDVDYTSEDEIIATWSGFIDHESGIKFYRVAIAPRCLTVEYLLYSSNKKVNTYHSMIQETEETSTKFTLEEDGFFRSSVLAYNNAMEPSKVVCSDGFYRDSTEPTVNNIAIKHSKVTEVIACDSHGPWLIRSDLKRIPLPMTDICAERCAKTRSFSFFENLEIETENNNETDIADDMCMRLPNYTDNWYIYIPSSKLDISWVSQDNETQIRSEEIGFATDPSTAQSPDIEAYKLVNGHSRYHKNHEGIDAGRPFYISIRVTNKANKARIISIGPVVIDETPPDYIDGLQVLVDKVDDKVYCFWRNDTFVDTEQKKVVDFVIFRIGSGGRFYTPMLQVPPGQKCPRQEMFGCVHFPLHKLQRQDEEKGLLFYFELYVYNMAEHFIMVRSDTFKLPSRYVPGHGTVVDIDPSAYATDMLATGNVIVETFDDVKVHFVTNVLCAAWFGFYHHQNVSFQVGIGTNDKTDNVIPFVSVSAKNIFHCFNTSKLVNNVRYFFLVKATCSAGSISVSSDGVTILDRDQAAKAIKIYAGSACENASSELLSANPSGSTNSTMYKSARKLNVGKAYTLEIRSDFELDADISSDDVVWLEDTRKEGILIRKVFRAITDFPLFMVLLNDTVSLTSVKVTILHCAQNIHAHSSSQILSAFWNVSSPFNGLIDSFYASLIRNDCKEAKFSESNKDCSTMICGLVKSNTDHNVTFEHLSLIDQRSYSVEIQACFGRLCLPSSFSSPVIVQYLPPSISIINASIESIGDDCVYLNINWKRSDCLSNYNNTAAAMYQWALALGENAESPLTLWSPVRQSHLTKQSQDTLRVKECVSISVYSQRLLYACIKTMCQSGAISTTCSSLKVPHPNDYKKSHLYELDANSFRFKELKPKIHTSYLGETLNELHELDLDFCRSNTTVAGVLPSPVERNITWYLTTLALIPSTLKCESDHVCVKSLTSQGGFAVFHKTRLTPGNKYYICAWSNATIVKRELFDEHLDEVRLCGNGFLVDDSPPTAGYVTIVNQRKGFLLGAHEIAVSWYGFTDTASRNYNSTIKGYSLAIGTSRGGTDVLPYQPVGHVHYVKVNKINLTNGNGYYASVKAIDHVGLSAHAISASVILDSTPPKIGSITVGGSMKHRYLLSTKHLTVHWTGFEDIESGIDKFFLGIGYQADTDNVKSFKEVHDQYADMSREPFSDGKTYFAVLKVTNKAGLWSTLSSQPFVLDSSPPTGGVVRDGENSNQGDVDFQNYTSSLTCHWRGFHDPHSGIHLYKVGLGTSPNTFDIYQLTSVGLRTEQTWTNHLIPGVKYFATVEACNGAGMCTRRYSDGVVQDDSPPIPGLVRVGFSNQHEKYHSHRNSVSAQWIGFEDPHSGLHHFEWCLTTDPMQCNLVPFTNVLLSKSGFKSHLKLPLSQDIFIRVLAYNNVGMVTETISDGFQVDDSSPILMQRPQFLLRNMQLSYRYGTQWDNSLLRLTWNFTDPESAVTKHVVQLHTHHDGKALKQISQLGNENHITVQMDKNELLKNGDKYTATVTACNAAGLCSSSESEDLLIDSSPPHMGGFKPPLTWENSKTHSTVLVTWYGFSDVESRIEKYFISASKDYSGSELSNGIIMVEANNETEQNMSTILTKPVQEGDHLILSIWATNAAGLRSDIGKVTVSAIKKDSSGLRGILKLQKHSCISHYCNNDCTCAVVGKKCERLPSAARCVDLMRNDTHFPSVTVLGGMLDHHQQYTASASCLASHWTAESNDTLSVLRYEWSMGISNRKPGDGFFDSSYESTWYDVGLHTNVTYCLPFPKTLDHSESYTIYVKAWYSETESKVFSSPPVHVDLTPPRPARGRSVYESVDGCSTDAEFIVNTSLIEVCWRGIFRESDSHFLKFELMAGSFPYGDDLIPVTDYGLATNATFSNLKLYEGTKYYFTVRAINTVGLHTSLCSDGVVLDITLPYTGVVFNTDKYRNSHFQSSSDSFTVSWHGFGDHHSHIHHFSVWVTDADTNETVANNKNVGIRTSVIFSNLTLAHNHTYFGSVLAWDAAGHGSEVVSSPLITIDNTPPLSFECANFSKFNFLEEKFGSDIFIEANLSKGVLYNLKVAIPESLTISTLQVSVGMQEMVLPLTDKSDGAREAHYAFLSSYDGNTKVNISFLHVADNTTAIVELSQCTSSNFSSAEAAIDVMQIGPYELSVFPHVMDSESGIRSLQLGMGTTKTGFQVLPLSSIPIGNQIKVDFDAMHGSVLHTTVIAYNNAGLRSVFQSKEITVDHTPPEIANVTATITLTAIENITNVMSATVDVHLASVDEQSGVKICHCQLGEEVVLATQPSHITQTGYDCIFHDVYVRHGTLVKTSARCVNNVELVSSMAAEPLTVSFIPPSTSSARVEIIPKSERLVNYAEFDENEIVIQDNLTCIQAQWDGFEDISGVSRYMYTVKYNNRTVLKTADTTTSYNAIELQGLDLKDGDVYTVEVEAVNNGGVHSEPVRARVRADSTKPKLSGHTVNYHRKESTLDLDWGDVFVADPQMPLLYDINVGTRDGYSDVFNQDETKATSVRIFVQSSFDSVWISIKAFYVTGKGAYYRGTVYF